MNARIKWGYGDSETFSSYVRSRDPQLDDWTDNREALIVGTVHNIADICMSDPAECDRIVRQADVPLYDIRVTLHGEAMTWQRAVLDVLHMASRLDDPQAIKAAADALRAKIDTAIRRDAGVYGLAAEEVALGE